MSNFVLVIYIITWIVTIIVYQKKKKHFDTGSLILFSYLVYSISSFLLYNNPFADYTFNQISLFPFVYLYLMLMLMASPILKYDYNKIDEIKKPNTLLLNIISSIFIVSSLANLPSIISDFSSNIIRLLFVSSGGQELYSEAMSNSFDTGDGDISNLAFIFSNAFTNIGVFLFFYYMTLEKRNKLISFGLFISVIISILSYISLGQRGLIIEILFVLLITYFSLKKFYSNKIKKIINVLGIFLFIATAVPLTALTISRFGNNKSGSLSSLYFYAGQENLYFNNYGLDNGGIRYGDRTFPLFKRILGFEKVPNNFWERRQKYQNLKINDEVFYTYVGDFTLDFGPFITTFIFILFTLFILIKTRIRNRKILFHQLILLHFVMYLCMIGGLKLYPFSDVGGNLKLLVYFFAYFIFRLKYNNVIQVRKGLNQVQ